jgi:integrase
MKKEEQEALKEVGLQESETSITVNSSQTQLPAYPHNRYIAAATSENTRKTYQSSIRQVNKWGVKLPCTDDTIIRYITDRAQSVNPRTLSLHLSVLRQWHIAQGFNDPTSSSVIQKTMEGIRRVHAKPKKKAKALRLEHIATLLRILHAKPESKKKRRDTALLLIAFFGAFRRSELVGIMYSDIAWQPEGVTITLLQSKTDQEGRGVQRSIPYGKESSCPVRALKHWLDCSNTVSGPIFRSINRWDQVSDKPLNPSSVNDILKSLARECGFDFIAELSSHSFRRGLSTSAAREKVSFELIKKQGGWKSDATVWEYIEEGQQFTDNAALTLMEKMDKLISLDT